LKPSPAPSSRELIAKHVLAELGKHSVASAAARFCSDQNRQVDPVTGS
jgi:hypothetical protein